MFARVVLGALGCLILAEAVFAQAGVEIPAGAPNRTEGATLFAFDDVSIPSRRNLVLTMHAATKHPGNPVLRRGKSGTPDSYRVQYYGSVLRHEGKFKMWYVAGSLSTPVGATKPVHRFLPAYAESLDGIHWTKPSLGLVEFGGNRNNNLLLVEPADLPISHLIVLYEPDDPDVSHRFKMMGLTTGDIGGGKVWVTSMPFYSGDGLRWRLAVNAKPVNSHISTADLVLPPEHFEQSGFFRWQGIYHLTGQQIAPWAWLPSGEPADRLMTVFRSSDFTHWPDTRTASFQRRTAIPRPKGSSGLPVWIDTIPGEQAHLPASIWNRGNVLLGVYGLWHGASRQEDLRLDLGLLVSNDGSHFREPVPDFVFLPYGSDGAWDARGLLSGQGFEPVGDQTYIWYGNWDISQTDVSKAAVEVGLATLRRDGFGSLSPKPGSLQSALVSCPVKTSGDRVLQINAEGLSKDAWLEVQLLDEAEKPLPGYSRSDAVRASGFEWTVTWKRKNALPSGIPFRIRMNFEGERRESIRLYALYLRGTS